MKNIFDSLKKHKRVIKYAFTLIVLVLMVYYLCKNRDILSLLEKLDFKYVIVIFFVQIVGVFLIAFTNREVISILRKEIPLMEAFMLQYVNSFLNRIISEAGAVYRGVFLKEVYKLPYTKYISTIASLYLINFLSYSVIGLLSLLYIYLHHHRISYIVLVLFFVVLITSIVIIVINPYLKNKKRNKLLTWIISILEGWKDIKREKGKLVILTLLSIGTLILATVQSVLVYKGLGFKIGFMETLYMSSLAAITTFVNITPDNLGLREGVYMFTSDVIGLDSDVILLGSLIIRAISLVNTFLIGGISYLILVPRYRSAKGGR
ncbi:MAG: lysylphosphatidylglycerol synthase transmembrane domain-containing protein [Candidatus Dojkabacteria bacterium]|jgi:uncharacterized protein (TIRG00374 family)